MKSKRKFLIPALAVVLTAALAVGVFFFYKAFKKRIDPEDQMIHSTQERIEYAQSCYKEFSKNPNKTYTVLVSLDSVTTEEFTQLFADCGGFTQVYDCITEGVDDPMYGGYLDCEGKTAAQLAAECYADTYDSICSELDSYDQQAAEIRHILRTCLYRQPYLRQSHRERGRNGRGRKDDAPLCGRLPQTKRLPYPIRHH